MDRQQVYELIDTERAYQATRWSAEFDNLNTPNDWVSYITRNLGKAVTLPWNPAVFRKAMVVVAALAVAVLERDHFSPRHYDDSYQVKDGFWRIR